MAWDGIWRLIDPPMTGAQVLQMQVKALAGFSSYAVPLGVKANGVYDAPTAAWVAEYQKRKNDSGYQPRLPANSSAAPGDCDYETKRALGLIAGSVITPNLPGAVAYAVPGTGGIWNFGPQWWVCERLDGRRIFSQGVFYNTSAFLAPDPMHSYVEAVREGLAEMLRLALPDPRPKIPIGYSMGADVVVQFLQAWPENRRDEIAQVITFGSPGRPPGNDESGSFSTNGGISRNFTPEWARARERSYHINGDMYSDAPGLHPFFYQILTRLELSASFAFYLFGLLTGLPTGGGVGDLLGGVIGGVLGGGNTNQQALPSVLGQQLLGLGGAMIGTVIPGFGLLAPILGLVTPGLTSVLSGPISLAAMLLNLPAIIQTLLALLKFLFTGAHNKYGGTNSAQIFGGTDAVINAAGAINGLRL